MWPGYYQIIYKFSDDIGGGSLSIVINYVLCSVGYISQLGELEQLGRQICK